ncbi:MAG: hypothetical protein IKG69_06100 [Atopobiaceae bacterium]|nr:hypothetical protein [Atopobiaceae bacterium]
MTRLGCEVPRVWTPPLRELTPDTTLGYDVIDFATRYLCIDLLPWERWLFIHALEIVGDFDGEWFLRFRIVLVLVARQNGKSVMGMVLSLFFMYILCAALILGTAQDLSQAEEVWEGAINYAQDNEELAEEIEQIFKGKGSKELRLTGYRRYKVATPNRKNTRGKTSNLVLFDELREHQSFQAWSAASKTTKAVRSAIVWCMSNAGDGTSVVLRHLRLQAHSAIGDPDGACAEAWGSEPEPDVDVAEEVAEAMKSIAIFEWSAPPGCDKWDRDAWAQANPSMGYGFLDESTIATDCATDPEEEFRVEDLCQWVTAATEPPFPRGAWEAGIDPDACAAVDSPLWFGVDASYDRSASYIAVCGLTPARDLYVEVVARGKGLKWVVDWFRERVERYGGRMRVALQGNGAPVSALADFLDAVDGVDVTKCVGRSLGAWCGRLWDAVAALDPEAQDGDEPGTTPIIHRPQPVLDLAANVAVTRPMGDGAWAWDRRKSIEDIAPLVAVTMAHGLATDVEEPQPRSAYEDYDLMML